jgi:hypothetical protein
VVWVAHRDVPQLSDDQLRWRAGIEDDTVQARTDRAVGWADVSIPAGSRDEEGTALPLMNIGSVAASLSASDETPILMAIVG